MHHFAQPRRTSNETELQRNEQLFKTALKTQGNNEKIRKRRRKGKSSDVSLGHDSIDKDKVGKECPEQDERLCCKKG